MTTPTTHPAWCTGNPQFCHLDGDHADDKTFISATGTGIPAEVTVQGGAVFPVVGVGLDWAPGWRRPAPAVSLWVTGTDEHDCDLYLTEREARDLVEAIQARLHILEGQTAVSADDRGEVIDLGEHEPQTLTVPLEGTTTPRPVGSAIGAGRDCRSNFPVRTGVRSAPRLTRAER